MKSTVCPNARLSPATQAPQAPLVSTAVFASGAAQERVSERYALQAVARHMLCGDGSIDSTPRMWRRLAGCHRLLAVNPSSPVHALRDVDIYHDAEHKRAYFGGLQSCASPWCCPVCNGQIYDYRKQELSYALEEWRERRGLPVLFITLTFRHRRGGKLASMLPAFLAAVRDVYSGRAFQEVKRATGYVGAIRGIELTYSDRNGWHPHAHMAWFCTSWDALDRLESFVNDRWHDALRANGLSGVRGVECVVKRSFSNDEYVAKFEHERGWDIDAELSYAARKRGKADWHWSPFDLLRLASRCGYGSREYQRLAGLYREYATATKGKSSIRWSRGLRAELGMQEELSDDAIASGAVWKGYPRLGWLDAPAWAIVVANDVRAELLAVAGSGDWSAVSAFLVALGAPPGTFHDWVERPVEVDEVWEYLSAGRSAAEMFPSWRVASPGTPRVPRWISRDARKRARRRVAA